MRTLESDQIWFKLRLLYLVMASHLSFLISKTGMVIVPFSHTCHGDELTACMESDHPIKLAILLFIIVAAVVTLRGPP